MNHRINDIIKVMGIKDDKAHEFGAFLIKECIGICLRNSHRDDDMGAIIARHIEKEML